MSAAEISVGAPAPPSPPPSPEPASPGVLRIVSSSVEASLERFSDPKLVAAGKVNVISLEAIQQRFGSRWELRKDQVQAFAARVLQRGLGASGVCLRVSETDFFIIHPELSRLAGQAACLGYLREVLGHFLGDADHAAAGVLTVTKIGKGNLEAAPVDAGSADAAANAIEAAATGRSDVVPGPASPKSHLVNQWTPFISNGGRELRVSATLEPVYELKGFTRIGFRMSRRVIDVATGEELLPLQIAALSSADALRIDMATITRGIDRLGAETHSERQLSLIIPISYTSAASRRGRAELVAPLKRAGTLVKLGVICEVLDIEGVPPSVLLAATSLLRPFSLLLVGRVQTATGPVISRLAGAGFQALSFECQPDLGDEEFLTWATTAVAAARRVAKSTVVYRASSTSRASVLAGLGASHVSLLTGQSGGEGAKAA